MEQLPSLKSNSKRHPPASLLSLLVGKWTNAAPSFSVNGLGSKAIRQMRINHSSEHKSQQKSCCKQGRISFSVWFWVLCCSDSGDETVGCAVHTDTPLHRAEISCLWSIRIMWYLQNTCFYEKNVNHSLKFPKLHCKGCCPFLLPLARFGCRPGLGRMGAFGCSSCATKGPIGSGAAS